jgi:protein-tyrosine-phosphatase
MKDKRTYTNLKEHGEDMSHENEAKITNEDRGPGDLSLLIEMHKKEIWEWKQKESEWIKTENLLSGTKKIIDDLSAKLIDQVRVIAELEKEIERLVAENKK